MSSVRQCFLYYRLRIGQIFVFLLCLKYLLITTVYQLMKKIVARLDKKRSGRNNTNAPVFYFYVFYSYMRRIDMNVDILSLCMSFVHSFAFLWSVYCPTTLYVQKETLNFQYQF